MPPKRQHSPQNTLPAKRRRTSFHSHINDKSPVTFDALYDELVLVVFSYLGFDDLCTVQNASRRWSRLACDNQLWKKLYLREFGRPRLRGLRGFVDRDDGREIKPLPSRANPEDITDWKWMFRISSNWKNGRCTTQRIDDDDPYKCSDLPLLRDSHLIRKHVILSGSLTITSLPRESDRPAIQVQKNSSVTGVYVIHEQHESRTCVTALSLDQSQPLSSSEGRLAVFFGTGSFSVYVIDHQILSQSRRIFGYSPSNATTRTTPIIQAVYHHPLLITLSKAFNLSLYNLSGGKVVHTQTLTSFTSFPPSSLVLSMPNPTTYKLILAYAMPVYPMHWSVAVTELTISSSMSLYSVTSTRTTRAFDVPAGWITEAKLRGVREQWGRKVRCVADAQTDGKWVVLAPGGSEMTRETESDRDYSSEPEISDSATTLQLYRLHLPTLQTQSSTGTPRLTFVRSLHGHVGSVTTLSVSDGRCVSLGKDGSAWVWDLENGWDTEIQSPRKRVINPRTSGSIVFDERQVVTTDESGVEVRRFDV